jgi:hypothetical protein
MVITQPTEESGTFENGTKYTAASLYRCTWLIPGVQYIHRPNGQIDDAKFSDSIVIQPERTRCYKSSFKKRNYTVHEQLYQP